jgi:hypothetical protein
MHLNVFFSMNQSCNPASAVKTSYTAESQTRFQGFFPPSFLNAQAYYNASAA